MGTEGGKTGVLYEPWLCLWLDLLIVPWERSGPGNFPSTCFLDPGQTCVSVIAASGIAFLFPSFFPVLSLFCSFSLVDTHNLHISDLLDAFVFTNRFRSDVTELRWNTSERGVSKKKLFVEIVQQSPADWRQRCFQSCWIYFTCPPAKELIENGWKEEARHI